MRLYYALRTNLLVLPFSELMLAARRVVRLPMRNDSSISVAASFQNFSMCLRLLLRKPETTLAVQLRTGKNGFNAFLYKARVPSVTSPLCSYGMGYQTAEHFMSYCCSFPAARHALRDDQGHQPDNRQLVMTSTGLKKVTGWVIERGMHGLPPPM